MLALGLIALAQSGFAAELSGDFPSNDGGNLSIETGAGNRCWSSTQRRNVPSHRNMALCKFFDRYRARGLVLLAVPSDDFNQELATTAEVKEFCTRHTVLICQ